MTSSPFDTFPRDLLPELLYVSSGEDKGDDVNFAIGIRGVDGMAERQRLFELLLAWVTQERCQEILGAPCLVVPFPKVQVVNVVALGLLTRERFDKQGKGLGRGFLELAKKSLAAAS